VRQSYRQQKSHTRVRDIVIRTPRIGPPREIRTLKHFCFAIHIEGFPPLPALFLRKIRHGFPPCLERMVMSDIGMPFFGSPSWSHPFLIPDSGVPVGLWSRYPTPSMRCFPLSPIPAASWRKAGISVTGPKQVIPITRLLSNSPSLHSFGLLKLNSF